MQSGKWHRAAKHSRPGALAEGRLPFYVTRDAADVLVASTSKCLSIVGDSAGVGVS